MSVTNHGYFRPIRQGCVELKGDMKSESDLIERVKDAIVDTVSAASVSHMISNNVNHKILSRSE